MVLIRSHHVTLGPVGTTLVEATGSYEVGATTVTVPSIPGWMVHRYS